MVPTSSPVGEINVVENERKMQHYEGNGGVIFPSNTLW